MTRLIVVVLTEIDDALMAALEGSNEIVSLCELRRVRRDTMSLAECETVLRSAAVLLCHPGLMMALLRELPRDVLCNVQWIQSTWAGVEALSQFFVERPPLPHVPVVVRFAGHESHYGHQMAEWFFAQVVAFERRFASQTLAQHAATPRWEPFVTFESLADKTLGIVGFGAIGQHVARVARDGFGMRVVALSRVAQRADDCVAETLYSSDQLSDLLRVSDYVLCLLPATTETRGMLDGGVLQASKRGALLVNAGRGSLLSEESILQAMQHRWIRGFIGDVWPVEPLPASSPLWRTDGVIVSPHVAAKPTPQTVRRVFERNLTTFVQSGIDALPHKLGEHY